MASEALASACLASLSHAVRGGRAGETVGSWDEVGTCNSASRLAVAAAARASLAALHSPRHATKHRSRAPSRPRAACNAARRSFSTAIWDSITSRVLASSDSSASRCRACRRRESIAGHSAEHFSSAAANDQASRSLVIRRSSSERPQRSRPHIRTAAALLALWRHAWSMIMSCRCTPCLRRGSNADRSAEPQRTTEVRVPADARSPCRASRRAAA